MKPRAPIAITAALAIAGGLVWFLQAQRHAQAESLSTSQSTISNTQSSPPLQPVVQQVVKDGPATPYLKLNYVIKELPTNLAQHDIDALIAFITGPQPGKFSDGEWGSLTNDIQEALSVQMQPNAKVAEALIATFRDESRSQLMRDYALQHIGGLAIYLVHTRDTRSGTLPEFFGRLVNELKSATRDPSKSWAGTAFNLLDGLLRAADYRGVTLEDVSAGELSRMALPVAANPQAPLNARLPALQLASRRKAPEALQQARAILADKSANVMLVQSAAAVVGEQGTRDDIGFLERLLAENRAHTQSALSAALQRLQNLQDLPK